MPKQIDTDDTVYVTDNGRWHTLLACAVGKDGGDVERATAAEADGRARACSKCAGGSR